MNISLFRIGSFCITFDRHRDTAQLTAFRKYCAAHTVITCTNVELITIVLLNSHLKQVPATPH